jgi:hypothetical protein
LSWTGQQCPREKGSSDTLKSEESALSEVRLVDQESQKLGTIRVFGQELKRELPGDRVPGGLRHRGHTSAVPRTIERRMARDSVAERALCDASQVVKCFAGDCVPAAQSESERYLRKICLSKGVAGDFWGFLPVSCFNRRQAPSSHKPTIRLMCPVSQRESALIESV